MACQAQLVNVIGLIFTEPGGAAWRQTIFHPFKIVTQHAHGSVLQTKVHCQRRETKTAGTIDDIVAAAVHDDGQRKVVFFVLNREPDGPTELSIDLRGFPPVTDCSAVEISGSDLLATNTAQMQETIQPKEHHEFSLKADKIISQTKPALVEYAIAFVLAHSVFLNQTTTKPHNPHEKTRSIFLAACLPRSCWRKPTQ